MAEETKPSGPAQSGADEAARRSRQRSEGETLTVLYQGPSDEFHHPRAGQMVKGGEPVDLFREELDDLRARFPDHSWGVV